MSRQRCRETGKVMFRTHAAAILALDRCVRMRRERLRTYRQERAVYLCDHCDTWHLTSSPR